MRVFIAVLVLILSFQSWTKADDISDFEVEGMSIGDSLLDHFSLDRIENATEFKINTIDHKWAGLRSFLPNRSPAVFEDPIQKGFFWLIGQGGYGIMTSPAISKIIECLVTGKKWPTYLENESIYPDTLNL